MKLKLSDLWRWDGLLSGGEFFCWGLILGVLKFNLDRLIAFLVIHQPLSVFEPETLKLYLWQSPLNPEDRGYYLILLASSLPFVWTGTVLTFRRLRTLGWKPYWLLLFFVPAVKLVFFAILCLLRTRSDDTTPPVDAPWRMRFDKYLPRSRTGSAAVAVAITAGLAVAAAWLGTAVFQDYGWTIFVGLPFAMGFFAAIIHSLREKRTIGECILVATLTIIIVGGCVIAVALEGLICILMAAPIALAMAILGGAMGYAVQNTFLWRESSPRLFCSVLLLVPLAMAAEHALPPALPLLAVRSSVVINAPPEKVWRHVVSFSELPPPTEMIFKVGVAYPIRAEISGCGVGAVRHCNFSTGPFVEPITVWDEPKLLKFSVTHNPEPMQEWTPYRDIHPAHLDGYLASQAGQFRLVPLEGNRTLLEGTTWYYHHLWPADYWQLWSDPIIHTIHLRVLNHVKHLAEEDKS